MSRAITPKEAALVEWLLDHAAIGDITAYRGPLPELQVVGGCACWCASLDFAERKGGARIIADALAVYPDGLQAGLILWGRSGEIVSLEVYDLHPGASHRVPEIANLRTFEQTGR